MAETTDAAGRGVTAEEQRAIQETPPVSTAALGATSPLSLGAAAAPSTALPPLPLGEAWGMLPEDLRERLLRLPEERVRQVLAAADAWRKDGLPAERITAGVRSLAETGEERARSRVAIDAEVERRKAATRPKTEAAKPPQAEEPLTLPELLLLLPSDRVDLVNVYLDGLREARWKGERIRAHVAEIAGLPPERQRAVFEYVDLLLLAKIDVEDLAEKVEQSFLRTPEELARARDRAREEWERSTGRRRGKRGQYDTREQGVILGHVNLAKRGRTAQIAGSAETRWENAYRRLRALERRGLVEKLDGKWSATADGHAFLAKLPEVEAGIATTPKEILEVLTARKLLRDRFRGMGWKCDQVRDVLPYYTVDHLHRRIAEALKLVDRGKITNPGGLLWTWLGSIGRAKREARKAAMALPKAARFDFVKAQVEEAKRKAKERERWDYAEYLVPKQVREVFLEATKDEPLYVSRWLAGSLWKRASQGHEVRTSDVHGILHWIRKRLAKRTRPHVEQTGEPRGPSPPKRE